MANVVLPGLATTAMILDAVILDAIRRDALGLDAIIHRWRREAAPGVRIRSRRRAKQLLHLAAAGARIHVVGLRSEKIFHLRVHLLDGLVHRLG